MNTLLIIDANNIASRAWYTNNRFGFFNMLLTAAERIKPTHVAFVFDAPGPSWRHEIYPAYKDGRASSVDKDEYISKLHSAVRKTGNAVYRIGEADDVIATLAVNMSSDDMHVKILSNDGDMMALASDFVTIVSCDRQFSNFVYIGPDEVVAKLGVFPSQIPDYKALVGDKSDNIPGVAGVGPVNARKALAECGSVTGIMNAISDGTWSKNPTWVNKVIADIANMELSYKLAAMRTNENVMMDPEWYACDSLENIIHSAHKHFLES